MCQIFFFTALFRLIVMVFIIVVVCILLACACFLLITHFLDRHLSNPQSGHSYSSENAKKFWAEKDDQLLADTGLQEWGKEVWGDETEESVAVSEPAKS